MSHDIPSVRDAMSRRNQLDEDAQRLLDRAALANRDLYASESRQFDRLMADLETVNRTIADAPSSVRDAAREELIDEARDAAGVPRNFGAPQTLTGRPEDLLAMIRSNGGGIDLNVGPMLAEKRTGNDGALEVRDLLTTTTGAPVPIQTAGTIRDYLISGSGVLRSNIEIMSTLNGDSMRLPVTTAYSTGTAVAEGSAIPESDPTLAMVTFGATKYSSKVEWSREFELDSNVNVAQYISRNLGYAISETIAPVLINGSGTAEPQGILAAAGGTVTGGTGVAGVPTVDEIIDLVFTLDAPYQAAASFVMHPTTLSTLAKVNDTTGRSILMPALAANMPSTIMGRPVYTDVNMPTTGTGAKSIFFGDLSRYAIVRWAGDLRVEVSYDEKFSSDLVVCKAVQRMDCRIVDSRAGAIYKGGAS